MALGEELLKKELTVIIPVYNDKLHLLRMLKSLESANNNQIAKILLVDDASDCTYEDIINKVSLDISYIRNDENVGVGLTRKKGRSLVDTEWFAYVDQDDYVLEKYFDSFLQMKQNKPEKMMMVFPKKAINYIYKHGEPTNDKEETIMPKSAIHYGGNFYHIDLFDKFGIKMWNDRMSDDIFINTLLGDFFHPCFDFIATDEESDIIYVWDHTNKKSISLQATVEETNKHTFEAHAKVKEFIVEYCKNNPNSDFVKYYTYNDINTAILYAEDKMEKSKQNYILASLSSEQRDWLKDFLETRIELYEKIKDKIKYINYEESELEFLTDVHMAILIEHNCNDDISWKDYWKIKYPNEAEPSMTIKEMQTFCDEIRVNNALAAISQKDTEYIKDLDLFSLVKTVVKDIFKYK